MRAPMSRGAEARANRRGNDRLAVRVPAVCRAPATPYRATILDISYDGCRVKIDDAYVTPGTTIIVDLAPGEVSGQVAWSDAQTTGIRFHRRLRSELAVRVGIEEARAEPAAAAPEPFELAPQGLSHWLRRVVGFVARPDPKSSAS